MGWNIYDRIEELEKRMDALERLVIETITQRKPRQWIYHEDTHQLCEQAKCHHIGGVLLREVFPEGE